MKKNIFYTSTYSPNSNTEWSGLGYSIFRMLKSQDFVVEPISPLIYSPDFVVKLKIRISNKMILPREKSVIKNYSNQIEKMIGKKEGIIFSPGTLPIAYYKGDNPVVVYTDATFASMLDYYEEFKGWSSRSIRVANEIEKEALERADILLYASTWAANSAINDYEINPSKIHVVPFGANLYGNPDSLEIQLAIDKKINKPLELLFIGVDWERKGGPKLLEVFNYIKTFEIDVRLHIVGPAYNPIVQKDKSIYYHGFLNKHVNQDNELLKGIFLSSHFFIMLSKAECYGLTYCEANAFGIPAIGYDTGGVSTVVTDSNGILFDPNALAEDIAIKLLNLFRDKKSYKDLCISSYKKYSNYLNWASVGAQINKLITDL